MISSSTLDGTVHLIRLLATFSREAPTPPASNGILPLNSHPPHTAALNRLRRDIVGASPARPPRYCPPPPEQETGVAARDQKAATQDMAWLVQHTGHGEARWWPSPSAVTSNRAEDLGPGARRELERLQRGIHRGRLAEVAGGSSSSSASTVPGRNFA